MKLRALFLALALAAGVAHAGGLVLRQSTNSQAVLIGPFVDAEDGNTAETGLTIDATDVRLSANGGNIVAKNSGGCTHDELGYYTCTFNATDTATVGRLQVMVHTAGALPVYHEFAVLEESIYDALYASSATGLLPANVTQIGGASVSTSSAQLGVNVVNWGGTVVGSATVNANMTQISGDSDAADALEAAFDGTAGPVLAFGIARQGTAQSATSTSIVLDSPASFADDAPIGMTVVACGSTQGYCQSRTVTDYVGSTDTATVDAWTVTPSGTITYYLFATAPASGGGSVDFDEDDVAEAVWAYSGGRSVSVGSGGITSGSFASGAITASAIASNAIGADELAADAGTEIGTAVWATTTRTLSSGSNIVLAKGTGITGFNDLDASGIRTAVGLSSANLDSQLSTIDGVVDAVKAVTDNLPDAGALSSLATASALSTVDGIVDDIKLVTDKLDDTLESDGGVYRFTANALEEAPTSGGGGDVDLSEVLDAISTVDGNVDAIKAVTDALPDAGALTSLASASALSTVDGVVDAIKVVTDKLDDTLEDNSGTYRFTEAALARAPGGSGGEDGVTDWDADERAAIRAILGIPVSGSTPADPSSGILDTIRDTVLAQNDLSSSDVQSAAAAALTAYDPPTHSELTSAISGLNDLSSSDVESAVSSALTTYDPPTRAELTSDINSVLSAISGISLDTDDLRDLIIEDQGGGVSLGCAISVILAYAAGDLSTSMNSPTFRDPSGSETRISGTISSDGNRSLSITCPSY